MRRRGIIFVLLALTASTMSVAEASFIYIPLEQLVERNPVAITGKVVRIKGTGSLWQRSKGYDLAMIQVDTVLKNETGDPAVRVGIELPLAVPSKIRESGQFRHKKGAEGVWLGRSTPINSNPKARRQR